MERIQPPYKYGIDMTDSYLQKQATESEAMMTNKVFRSCTLLFFDQFGIPAVGIGGGYFAGILVGWALKKIIKLFAIISFHLIYFISLKYQQNNH
ncbi:MAG TPA: hypothetical protein VHJ59_03700 [Nitrososphaera sp.]|nr:hypothetical protein [Nitrososphaera sp.]